MRVSGFTIARNAVRYDYPLVESMRSILPLVDEFVVNVGDCDDGTLERIQSIDSPKIQIIHNAWDPKMYQQGRVLAHQTNLALARCTGDWCFYLQADEVVHEDDCEAILHAMRRYQHRPAVEGLSFRYLHFHGGYGIRDPLSYRRQIRIIRNGIGIQSVGDACGFGRNGRRLRSRATGAHMYHYGYVRPPMQMSYKMREFHSLYCGIDTTEAEDAPQPMRAWRFDLNRCVPFRGTHPAVMNDRVRTGVWTREEFRPIPPWRNPHWWKRLAYKNSSTFRRLLGATT